MNRLIIGMVNLATTRNSSQVTIANIPTRRKAGECGATGQLRRWPAYALAAVLAVVVAIGLSEVPAMAQVSTGSVVGTVTDSTGAAVPGAKVVLKNSETNVSQTAITGSAGKYTLLNLILSMCVV